MSLRHRVRLSAAQLFASNPLLEQKPILQCTPAGAIMLRFFRVLLVIGILHGAIVIRASAQTPSSMPNTAPSGQRPEGTAANTGGSTTSGISGDTSATNPPAGSSTGTR